MIFLENSYDQKKRVAGRECSVTDIDLEGIDDGSSATRTQDQRVKSPLLYRLS